MATESLLLTYLATQAYWDNEEVGFTSSNIAIIIGYMWAIAWYAMFMWVGELDLAKAFIWVWCCPYAFVYVKNKYV